MVDGVGTWHEVSTCPDDEHESRETPCEDGKSRPLDYFAKVVGGGDVVVEAFLRQVVARIARLAKVSYDMVAVHVDGHTSEEEDNAYHELRCEEPCCSVHVVGCDEEYPLALHVAVDGVENNTHEHDGNGHFAFAFKHEGEYE